MPFLTVADRYLGGAALLAWLAGIVSVLATLVSAANSQARMLFDGGRSGLLPAWLGQRSPANRHASERVLAMGGIGLGIIGVWWLAHVVGADRRIDEPGRAVRRGSTMGTIVILFVYLLTTLALPVFMWRRHRQSFSALRHVAIPALWSRGADRPVHRAFKPGQPAPYSDFPYLAVAIGAAGVIGWVTVRRHPSAGSARGSFTPTRMTRRTDRAAGTR